jgi:endonuclease/exonuclease/phosphatase family metal-dependent hydrolase
MRVATFNILHGRNPADDVVDVTTLAAAVGSLDADVLALQEVDRNQPRSHGADLTAVAAAAMGAVDHRFVAAMTGSPGAAWVAATGAEQPDAATYGVALLSRHPVEAWQVVKLPVLRAPTPMWFKGRRLPELVHDEPRVAVAAAIATPEGPLTAVCTHLSFVPWWNGHQLRSLVRSLGSAGRPLVLMGDLNMGASRACALTGMSAAASHPTFPSGEPREQLDHILLDGDLSATRSDAPHLPVSDHRALVADLTVSRRRPLPRRTPQG